LGGARALLHLIDFEEPFGLSVVESMACGTPVIASRRGSMPELIRDGENGFLVDSIEAAVESVSRAGTLDRGRVRASVSQRFAVGRMVEDYLAVYHRVVSGSGQPVE
jgi:glycosyltransferase involved in cell wall biosynthesis